MIPNIRKQLARDFDTIRNRDGAGGEDILMRWKEISGLGNHDPQLQSSPNPSSTMTKSETIRGFILARTLQAEVYQKFANMKVGDIVIDIPADIDFENKEQVKFEIEGVTYTQKSSGKGPAPTIASPSTPREGIQRIHLTRNL